MDVAQVICVWLLYRRFKRRRRQYWVAPILTERLTHGHYITLYPKLRQCNTDFKKYFRMSINCFDKLISAVKNNIASTENVMRESVSPEEKLVVTLRFLSTGCTFGELHQNYRLGRSTISVIIRNVCEALYITLKETYMPEPTEERWLNVEKDFNCLAMFPNCIGAIDGKLIRIAKRKNTDPINRKQKYFSTVLLAICDCNYNFIFVDVGDYGKFDHARIFKNSLLYKKIERQTLNIPPPKSIADNVSEMFPYVFVGDGGFSMLENLMRPYTGRNLTHTEQIFNYRLSRARRYIECAFGMLSKKWRVFQNPINVNFVDEIIKCCCILHNFILSIDGWKFNDTLFAGDLPSLSRMHVGRSKTCHSNKRDLFASYFVNDGKVEWQDKMVESAVTVKESNMTDEVMAYG